MALIRQPMSSSGPSKADDDDDDDSRNIENPQNCERELINTPVALSRLLTHCTN